MRNIKLLLVSILAVGMVLLVGCGKSSTAATNTVSSSIASPGVATAGAAGSAAAPTTGGASTCPTTNTTNFAKSKFVLHVGLAAGTFHRYLYKPLKAGSFHKGASGRLSALVKGSGTALFDEHELRLAIGDVKANPTLCHVLIAPLTSAADKFGAMKSKLTGGDTSSLESVNADLASISSTSAKDGAPITESTDESAGWYTVRTHPHSTRRRQRRKEANGAWNSFRTSWAAVNAASSTKTSPTPTTSANHTRATTTTKGPTAAAKSVHRFSPIPTRRRRSRPSSR